MVFQEQLELPWKLFIYRPGAVFTTLRENITHAPLEWNWELEWSLELVPVEA